MWQEGLEVFDGLGGGEIDEDPAQGVIGFKPCRLTGLDETIKVGGGSGISYNVMEESNISTKTEGAQGILGRIGIKGASLATHRGGGPF